MRALTVAEAPARGGSRVIHIDMIRSAVAAAGTNMATVRLGGATRCAVTRPADPVIQLARATSQSSGTAPRTPEPTARNGRGLAHSHAGKIAGSSHNTTLRQAVVDYFNAEFARYGGKAEVLFDHTSQQVLDLRGPTYEFVIRRRNGSPLGLTSIEAEVLSGGLVVQTVPLVAQVTMVRSVVTARRSINAGATIRASDVDLIRMSFTRFDKLGLDDTALAVGQRARRFMPAGTFIAPSMLEAVPLVVRGQLVTMTAQAGGIRVVTTGKAASSGLLGERITVRAANNRRVEFDGIVTGPGEVLITTGIGTSTRLAMGGS
ncbi:MAG: flagellar basal body P-ring formation protein FlgA [Planctomycetes bacterium]|nr:flagellar basal body P-ring formation protein FlgA [Planctomycetota bacterium]